MTNLHHELMKVDKLDVSYLTGGQGDPLVVIHGGGNSSRSWIENAKELSSYYHVYVPDLPGFGCTQSIEYGGFSLADFTAFIDKFTKSLGLQCFHLVGHSLGGAIALQYALSYPSKVNRLVLVSSLCLGKEIALWARFASCLFYPVGKVLLFTIGTFGWPIQRLVHSPHRFKYLTLKVMMNIGKSVMTLKGQTMVLFARLSELLIPTLLVWGKRDNIVPVDHAYAAAQLISDCQLHVFGDCGHSVYREKVPEFSQLLVNFLDRK